jgi:hypothetical protein
MPTAQRRIEKLERALSVVEASAPVAQRIFYVTSDESETTPAETSGRRLDGLKKCARGIVMIVDRVPGKE